MRIALHGQQAFGKAVLEALLERGDDVVVVYAPPEGPREDPLAAGCRWPPGCRWCVRRRFATRPLVEAFRALRAGPPGHGVRHADRAGGVPRRPDAGHHPVPPVAPAASSRAACNQLAGHQGRDRRPASPCSGRTAASTPATCSCSRPTPISETDTLGSVFFERLFPLGVEAMLEAVDLVAARDGTADPAGRSAGHLRGAVRAGATPASTGGSRAGSFTTSCAAATRRREPGPPAAARPCRSSRRRRSPPAMSRASAARWERSSTVGADGFSVVCADGRSLRVTRVRPSGGGQDGRRGVGRGERPPPRRPSRIVTVSNSGRRQGGGRGWAPTPRRSGATTGRQRGAEIAAAAVRVAPAVRRASSQEGTQPLPAVRLHSARS